MNETMAATYRLQFHKGFPLEEGAALADYLKELGITHLYASPLFKAAPGSLHGYDVVDPRTVNPELGGGNAFTALVRSLERNGLGLVLDIVPNHMAIGNEENVWWQDVLENGPFSRYERFFDIDWNVWEVRLQGKVLLPVLADHYGRVLKAGKIRLDRRECRFFFGYEGMVFPLSPQSRASILIEAAERAGSEALSSAAGLLERLSVPAPERDQGGSNDYYGRKAAAEDSLKELVGSSPKAGEVLDAILSETNGNPERITLLLDRQYYRLAHWRTASQDLNYRRFFDVTSLAGLRCEDPRVFASTHELLLKWLKEGLLSGLRVDHPDGLRDPAQYFLRLRQAAPNAWIVAEKILEPGEKIPGHWPIDGTTGYDFMNLVTGLFIDPAGEIPLTGFYREFTREERDFHTIARESKHLVMRDMLSSEIHRLSRRLTLLFERHPEYRDFTRYEAEEAIREIIACLPLYRSYIETDKEYFREEDRIVIAQAVSSAKEHRTDIDHELLDFIGNLFFEPPGTPEREFTLTFQQVTGAVTAKGVEDTSFYVYNRFVALNEVGGDPSRFGATPEEFHRVMDEAARERPRTMLATSTHDSKRSEDVRARLAAISEIPEVWIETIRRWSEMNEKYRSNGAPGQNMEYLIYQNLAGAWPIDETRLSAYVEKAAREAKTHTSWLCRDESYEEGLRNFIRHICMDKEFQEDLERFVDMIAGTGRINSLAQVLLKTTVPGIPDFYQGMELWDLSLVDPDNRRPVDYNLRRKSLQEIDGMTAEEILAQEDRGIAKLFVMKRALTLRNRYPHIFSRSGYSPLEIAGDKKNHIIAFLRGDKIATVVPRLVFSLRGAWGNTAVDLPGGSWRNVFTGETITGGAVPAAELFQSFPVALLEKEAQ